MAIFHLVRPLHKGPGSGLMVTTGEAAAVAAAKTMARNNPKLEFSVFKCTEQQLGSYGVARGNAE